MRRIFFLNRYFFPDHSATSQILSDLAFHLAAAGNGVHVVTSRQRYDDPDAQLATLERIDDVEIHRVATTRFGRTALLGRGADYLSFYHSVGRSLVALARPGDIVVAKTDPPLLCVAAMRAARRRGLHLVNWLQDLYPEVAVEFGVPLVDGPLAPVLYRLRDAALRGAAANVVVGERMAKLVQARGVPPGRVHVIPNWCDDADIQPLAHADNPLRREWGLEDRFVVGYSGNLGRGHEFDTIIAAAEGLRDLPRMLFLCIGGGSRFDQLVRAVAERGLESWFHFMPYQERARLKHSLAVADVHWISLKPELEGLIVPSKFYGIAAAGRPIVMIGDAEGELARLIRQYGCGIVVQPGQGQHLADSLRQLIADPAGLAEMGRRARHMLDARYTRQAALRRWQTLLAETPGYGEAELAQVSG
jgi:colanic acid biosynthesis glycosyl transferase WcaI